MSGPSAAAQPHAVGGILGAFNLQLPFVYKMSHPVLPSILEENVVALFMVN